MSTNLLTSFLKEHSFDESSKCWNKNKARLGNGTYKYICGFIRKNNEMCKNKRYKNGNRCKLHKNL